MIGSAQSVFISYSHLDEEWKDRLLPHLRVLEAESELKLWEDREIEPGDEWRAAIEQALATARVALVLVSAHSLSSAFILGQEVPALLRRHTLEGLRVVPVLLRPCAWQEVKWLAGLQMVPTDGRALSRLTPPEIDDELARLARNVGKWLREATRESTSTAALTVPPVAAPPDAQAPQIRPGSDPLADYQVIKEVHVGHYGRVLKCRSHLRGDICIVKETEARHVNRSALEALAELRFPNVAAPRRIWESRHKVFEELPYVGGVSLRDLVVPDVGGLQGSLLESFEDQLARVLRALHGAGIIHRDVHPSNIYAVVKRPEQMRAMDSDEADSAWRFDAFGRAPEDAFLLAWVLVDCTFATLADHARHAAYRHGVFTAPEQEDGDATTESDMYSFGATLWYGISGAEPPSAQNRRFQASTELDVPSAQHSDRNFGAYLRALLDLDPARRPAARPRPLRAESIIGGYAGTMDFGDLGVVIVDAFPSATVLVSRGAALEFHRSALGSADPSVGWGREYSFWVERLSRRWIATSI